MYVSTYTDSQICAHSSRDGAGEEEAEKSEVKAGASLAAGDKSCVGPSLASALADLVSLNKVKSWRVCPLRHIYIQTVYVQYKSTVLAGYPG